MLVFLQRLSNIVIAVLTTLADALLRLQADRAATDLVSVIARFECFLSGHFELIVLIDDGHPVAELVRVVHAVAICSRAFDEWRGTKIFQT
jgi:hypothetical protein